MKSSSPAHNESCSPVEMAVNKLSSRFHAFSSSSDSTSSSGANSESPRTSSSSSSCESNESTSPTTSGIVYGNIDPLEFACSPDHYHIATVAKKARERRRNSLAPRRTHSMPRPSRNAKSMELSETVISDGVLMTTLCSTEL